MVCALAIVVAEVAPCVPDRSEALALAGPIRRATASGATEADAVTYDPVPRTCDEQREFDGNAWCDGDIGGFVEGRFAL